MTATKIHPDDLIGQNVSVSTYPGVAFWVKGYVQRWDAAMCYVTDEFGDDFEWETGEGEWVDDRDSDDVIAVMVGDDREHQVATQDCTIIDEDDYCGGCGQTAGPKCFGY
jgi:hypothetical protein